MSPVSVAAEFVVAALAAIAALSFASTLGAAGQSYLSQYDLIVSNNLSTSTDIRGLVVAKNYTGTAGGPMAPRPSTAVPLVTTATRLARPV